MSRPTDQVNPEEVVENSDATANVESVEQEVEASSDESTAEAQGNDEGEASAEASESVVPAAPKNENMGWYIVNCQTSCENVARMAINERIQTLGMEKFFGEILIPSENIVQLIKGKKQTRARKFFPGYIFVNMEMNEQTWHLVRKSSKVTGFIGGQNPKPVTQAEVDRVTQQMIEGAERPKPKVTFSVGDTVTVVDGPFSSFAGSVQEINEEKAKVKVSISVFGRPTPVELDFIQVEKG